MQADNNIRFWGIVLGAAAVIGGFAFPCYMLGVSHGKSEIEVLIVNVDALSAKQIELLEKIEQDVQSMQNLQNEIARVDTIFAEFADKGVKDFGAASDEHQRMYTLLSEWVDKSIDPDGWLRWETHDSIAKFRKSYKDFSENSGMLLDTFSAYKSAAIELVEKVDSEITRARESIAYQQQPARPIDPEKLMMQPRFSIDGLTVDELQYVIKDLDSAKKELKKAVKHFEVLDRSVSIITTSSIYKKSDGGESPGDEG